MFEDGTNNNNCPGLCPSTLVSMLNSASMSGVSSVALQLAIGGPSIHFSQQFKFPWVKFGCQKFIEPLFIFNNMR